MKKIISFLSILWTISCYAVYAQYTGGPGGGGRASAVSASQPAGVANEKIQPMTTGTLPPTTKPKTPSLVHASAQNLFPKNTAQLFLAFFAALAFIISKWNNRRKS